MLRFMLAPLALAAPVAAAAASPPVPAPAQAESAPVGDWGLAAMPNGCMVQAVSPAGTMLSIWGFAGQEKIAFLLQNRDWNSLRDGAAYDLNVDFLGVTTLPVEATARQEIDSDGPGFFFTVEPGGSGDAGFLEAFSTAEGMRILQDGRSVDTLSLAGSRGAMASLARCLAEKWSAAGEPTEEAPAELASAEEGVEI